MTLSCEQCVDIVALAMEIQIEVGSTPYGQKVERTIERNDSLISYTIDEDLNVTINRVFAQNQESRKLAGLLTDYFNE